MAGLIIDAPEGGLGLEEETPATEPVQEQPVEAPAAEEKPKEVSMPDQIPEKYEFADESETYSGAIGKVASEIGIGQDKAQRLLNAVYAAQEQETLEQAKEWVAQAKKDPELGRNFDEAQRVARRTLDRYIQDKNFIEVLGESGLGSHPEFIRMLYRIGKDIPDATLRRSMFPNSHMEY